MAKQLEEPYKDHCAFNEVCKYAAVRSEHAEQVALFMWAARANCELDKLERNELALLEFNCWQSQIYHERRCLSGEQIRALKPMFAIPNGGERAAPVAARMKAEGVKTGVSDVMLPVPMYTQTAHGLALNGCGLFIEMKRPEIYGPGKREGTKAIIQSGGKVSPEQEAWFKLMRANGYKCAVAWTFLEALDRIWEYFNAS